MTFQCPTVGTERLVLRPFVDDDVDDYFAIHDTPEVRHWLRTHPSYDRSQAWAQLAFWMGQWALRNSGQWAVVERETGRMVGRAGTHRPERPDWPGLEVGWTFHPDVWGRGYATEAGRAAVEWAFANHPDDRLVSTILPSNTASQAVARRLGFTLAEPERVLSHFPLEPHGIWELPRP